MRPAPLALAAIVTFAAIRRRRQLRPTGWALAGLGLAGLLAYGAGLVDLPNTERAIRDLTSTLGPYAYALVGLLALLETGAGMGFIVPGEIAVILGGVSAGHGQIQLPALIAIVWACALTGDLISFVLGRRLGRSFLLTHGPRFGIGRERVQQAERFFAAHGVKTIIAGRFVGFVRPLTPFIAGSTRMPARRFIPCTALAAGLWAATFSVLGYLFWGSLDELIAAVGHATAALTAVLVTAAVALAALRRAKSRRASDHGPPAPPATAPAPAPAGGE